MQHLESDVLDIGDDAARTDQLAVGEDVAVDEIARLGGAGVVRPGDAVVEEQAAVAQLVLDEAEVERVVVHTDVLGEPDRGHRVELALHDVAVVAVPDLGELAEPLLGDLLLRPGGLLGRQRRADHLDPAPGRVADHAAPAAADVEQPVALLQPQLVEDQPVLVLLGLFQGPVGITVDRAGVGHRRAEHVLVELVGDVVVVVDGLGVASLGVAQALQRDPAPARQRLLRRRRDRLEPFPAERARDGDQRQRRRPMELHGLHGLQDVVRIARVHPLGRHVAGDIGAGHAEIARRRRQIVDAARVLDVEGVGRVLRPRRAAVVGPQADRDLTVDERLEHLGNAEPVPQLGEDLGSVLECRHLRCTAFEYRFSSRWSGS